MSGSIGANRIPSSAVKKTVDSFIEKVLKKYPTFKSAKITGSYNIIPKDEEGNVIAGYEKEEGHGDIDLVVELEGSREDMKKIKADFAAYLNKLPNDVTVPFRAGRHTGKKTAGTGDIVITQYPIEGFPDLTVQIDNMIVSSEEESTYRTSFLDIPGPKQALLIGLAKTMCIEEDPNDIFQRLAIKDVPPLQENQEYEFTLSSKGLTLRIVTLENFRETARQDIWMSYGWSDVETLFKDYNINGSFKELLDQLASKQWKSQRSKNRIKGTFKSMLVIGSGEVGTPKGADKEAALDKVNQLLSEALDDGSEIVALYAGGFKPPHLAHFANAKFLSNQADKIVVFIGHKIRKGVTITAEQSRAIWEIYANHIDVPVEIEMSLKSPITDTYEWIDANQGKVTKIITGAISTEMSRFAGIKVEKQKGNYKNVEVKELPIITNGEDDKFSGTDIRKSQDFLLSGKWIPEELSQEERQAVLNIVTPQKQDSIEDKMLTAVDEVFESFFPKKQPVVDFTGIKFDGPISEATHLQKALHEVTLSRDNAVDLQGDLTGGTFKVGERIYNYSIKNFPNPYNDGGLFYNIGFNIEGSTEDVPTKDTSPKNYLKIISTMYKVIMDFVEKEQPDYIGIASLDNLQGKNYHTVYANLTDNSANRIPGYFRKDANLLFSTPQGKGRIVVMKKKLQTQPLDEGSSGTPIQPSGAIPSKDRADLEHLFTDLRASIDSDKYTVVFNQDRIDIYIKTYSDVAVDQTPWQKHLPEGVQQQKFNYTPYIGSILEYMLDQGMKIHPLPEVKIRYDEQEANDFFGKTAYYDPNKKEVILYAMGRLPKDVCRSFTHEMIHHMQNLEGRLGHIGTTNTNEDDHLQDIEKEAYLKGNMTFRNWEDGVKDK